MVIRKLNFGSMVVAGFVGGWMMWFIDFWFSGTLGLWGMFPPFTDWNFMVRHMVESIIFIIPFAWAPLYYKLPGPGWFKGVVYGTLWWFFFVFIATLVGVALGATTIKVLWITSFASLVTQITLHWVWGFVAGILYIAPERQTATTTP